MRAVRRPGRPAFVTTLESTCQFDRFDVTAVDAGQLHAAAVLRRYGPRQTRAVGRDGHAAKMTRLPQPLEDLRDLLIGCGRCGGIRRRRGHGINGKSRRGKRRAQQGGAANWLHGMNPGENRPKLAQRASVETCQRLDVLDKPRDGLGQNATNFLSTWPLFRSFLGPIFFQRRHPDTVNRVGGFSRQFPCRL